MILNARKLYGKIPIEKDRKYCVSWPKRVDLCEVPRRVVVGLPMIDAELNLCDRK